MPEAKGEVSHGLMWLLIYRAAVATALFALTLAADLSAWQLQRVIVLPLYAVAGASFCLVLLLGVLLRAQVAPRVLAAAHLLSVVAAAAVVVRCTGGVESTLSFMFVLAILDAAVLGGAPVALFVASSCSVLYGLQAVAQLYHIWPLDDGSRPSLEALASAASSHLCAFYLCAWLAGHLAELWRGARAEVAVARTDLERAETMYARVLESLPVGVLTVDAERRLQLTNAVASDILGLPAAALSPGAPVPEVLRDFAWGQDSAGGCELQVADKTRYLNLSRSPLRPAPGAQAPSWVIVMDDVTYIHTLQESLRRREKMASIGELSAAMAHELRNPLAAISGCVELFGKDVDAAADRDRLGAIVIREIDRLNALIGDFLAYARPSAPSRAPVDLVTLVREVCAVAARDSRFEGHAVVVDGPDGLHVEADPGQMRQVVWNLLKNALEASPPGAEVTVCVRNLAQQGVTVDVTDRGPGIAVEVRDHLFEPFVSTKDGGTGLGLAVVHSILDAHGGAIFVASAAAEAGTCMRVVLPR